MHKNFIWQSFLLVVLLTTLWYTGKAAYKYYGYARLTQKAIATDMKWSIQELSDEDYILESQYTFKVGDHLFQGMTSFANTPYRNQYSATKAKAEMSAQKWIVWYDASNPHNSSLQKDFPLKECVYAILLWGLMLYFLWISFYVAKFKG